jgi:CHAT domain-containing protein
MKHSKISFVFISVFLTVFWVGFWLELKAAEVTPKQSEALFQELMKYPQFKAADGELSAAYSKARAALDANRRVELQNEQREWIKTRDRSVLFVSPETRLEVAVGLTSQRARQLAKRVGVNTEAANLGISIEKLPIVKGSLTSERMNVLHEELSKHADFLAADQKLNQAYIEIKKSLSEEKAKAFQESQQKWLKNIYEMIYCSPRAERAAFATQATQERRLAILTGSWAKLGKSDVTTVSERLPKNSKDQGAALELAQALLEDPRLKSVNDALPRAHQEAREDLNLAFQSVDAAYGSVVRRTEQRTSSNWEDILKNESPHKKEVSPKKRSWTDGLQIDTFTRIDSTSENHWKDLLRNDEKRFKSTINDTKEVRELIDQMAKADRETPDSSVHKSLVISEFGLKFATIGDFTQAQQCCLRAFKLAEQNSGDNAKLTLLCMKNLADLFIKIGDDERAIMILKDGLESAKACPEDSSSLVPIFQARLSEAQLQSGLYKQAEENSSAALELGRKEGSGVEAKALALESRALYLRSVGDIAGSEMLLREELAAFLPTAGGGGSGVFEALKTEALLNLYELLVAQKKISQADAVETGLTKMLQKSNGIFTPAKARFLKYHAVLSDQKGNREMADKSAKEYLRYVAHTLEAALSLVEAQRLGWQRTYLDYSLPVALCTREELADLVIRWKGIVLDSLIGDRVSLGKNNTEVAITTNKDLSYHRQKLVQLQMSASPDPDESKKIKNHIFHLERKMADETRHYYNAKVSEANLEGVKGALGDSEALVEFISYRDVPDIRYGAKLFGAMVISRHKPVAWIPLGSNDAITQKIDGVQSLLSGADHGSNLELRLQELYCVLWQEVARLLPETVSNVYISPDGILSFVPFSCLLDERGKFTAECYSISYVGSGRDLLVKSTLPKSNEIRIFANPKFELGNTPQFASRIVQRSAAQAELDKVLLPPLPGTEREADELALIASSCNWKHQILLSTEADKMALTNLRPPGILHLATHGFYLGGVSRSEAGSAQRGMVVKQTIAGREEVQDIPAINPMIQSGIALTGAQTTLNLWKNGRAPDPANDGVLTAQDVACLDLKGTWLVTLSACETGKGETKSGEGVFGLRRAFMMAGAQNLVMTLWPVSDQVTPKIMADFYKAAIKSQNAPESLSKTQRDWLVKLRNQSGILEAVRDAGPFSMVVMANPNLKSNEVIYLDVEIKEKREAELRERQKSMSKNKEFDYLDKILKIKPTD